MSLWIIPQAVRLDLAKFFLSILKRSLVPAWCAQLNVSEADILPPSILISDPILFPLRHMEASLRHIEASLKQINKATWNLLLIIVIIDTDIIY